MFAIAASRVVQVVRYEEAGDIPLVDLTHRFNGTPAVIGPRTCLIVIGELAVIADEATDFVTFDAILEAPDLGTRIALPYLAALAVGREQEPLSIVLDVDALHAEESA
jgi:chemotaxis signal transduction protein